MNFNAEAYLSIPYLDGGRSGPALDCWGLALAVRRDLGRQELPEVGGLNRLNPLGMRDGYRLVTSDLTEGAPSVGALAAVLKGRAFAHVGVVISVDGRMAVMETNPGTGVRWQWLERFMAENFKVVFYNDPDLPQQAQRDPVRGASRR